MSNKIVFFTNALHQGGIASIIYVLAEAMLAQGIAVEVLLIKREGSVLKKFENNHIPIASLNGASRNSFPIVAMCRYIETQKPYAIIGMGGSRNSLAILANMFCRSDTKIAISEHGIITYNTLRPTRYFVTKTLILMAHRILALLLYHYADYAIAGSKHTARWMEKISFLKRGAVTVMYNPVYNPNLLVLAQAPTPHPWLENPQTKVVIAAGRLHPVKDFGLLINAFHIVRQHMACKLIIIGDGPEKENLAALVKELHLENDVHMTGFVENPYAYMKHASVLVVSSRSEGLSNVLIEAMACGCQVIATDCPGGIREVLEDGRYGTLVPVGNIPALADAIGKSLAGESFVQTSILVERGKQFSVEQCIKSYQALLGFTPAL